MDSIWWARLGLFVSLAGALLLSAHHVQPNTRNAIARFWELVRKVGHNPYQIRVLAFALLVGLILGLVIAGVELVPGMRAQGLGNHQAWLWYGFYFVTGFLLLQIPGYAWLRSGSTHRAWRALIFLLAMPGWAALALYLFLGFAVLAIAVYVAIYSAALTRKLAWIARFEDSVGGVGSFLLATGAMLQLVATL